MNNVILTGRLTADPEVRYSMTSNGDMAIARYTIAVDRRTRREGEQNADFIRCVAFGTQAEFVEKYLSKGMKIGVVGSIQTGSYTDREGRRIYTTDIIVNSHEFLERKKDPSQAVQSAPVQQADEEGFMNIPDGIDEELPFH